MSVVRHVADRIAVMYLGKIVETAPAAEIFDNPLHPYTQALLSSVPTLTRRRFTKRIVLEGDVPTAIDPPGVPLREPLLPRDRALPSEVPPLEGIAGDAGHRVACFNYKPIAADAQMKAEAVQATTADGVTLRGELVRGGDVWICLVHDVGEDIDAWRPLRPGLARKGWAVLALDLRGPRRLRRRMDEQRGELDVDLAVTLARRLGGRHVSVVAAGKRAVMAPAGGRAGAPGAAFALPDSLVLVSAGPLDGVDPDDASRSGPAEALRAWREGSAGWRLRGPPQGLDRLDGRRTFGTEARGSALVAGGRRTFSTGSTGCSRSRQRLRGLRQARAASLAGSC